jgi:hypothetical protein
VIEAATLDGYGATRRLLRITLPLISPVLLFLLVVLVIFGFQAFAQVDILTKGAPPAPPRRSCSRSTGSPGPTTSHRRRLLGGAVRDHVRRDRAAVPDPRAEGPLCQLTSS